MSSISIELQYKVDELVGKWLEIDPNPSSRAEIESLHTAKNYDVLSRKMHPRIAFGTAGLRSSMEPGFAHMNDVTILQASQGLVTYVLGKQSDKANGEASIVIGYDHRFHSQRYAELTASVALASGLTVYYLGSVDDLSEESTGRNLGALDTDPTEKANSFVHTPLVPFSIDHYGASAGVMVTASHNPARDNGYKVYYGNGCQIIPPHDHGIAACIDENLEPWHDKNVWDIMGNFAKGRGSGKLVSIRDEITALYVTRLLKELVADSKFNFSFVYTPIHGVGGEIFGNVCAALGVEPTFVEEQAHPDPNFSTVKFPNPEEAGALDLAIALAKSKNYKLVLANDPDADRFSVAVETKGGDWRQLTGNEIGLLFAAFVLEERTDAADLAQTYLVNSTVSSQILSSMAQKLGCHFQDTLTGFKWIGNKAIDLKSEGYTVPFGYEEAIGYMFGLVNDKDGISAAVIWMQLYEKWFADGQTDALEKLEQIYRKYGWFKECNGYYKLDDLSKTTKIFNETIRAGYDAKSDYPRSIANFEVVEWRDLTVGFESTTSDRVPVLPSDPSSQMITAVLRLRSEGKGTSESDVSEKVRFTCRGSGTEPKLKVYIEGQSEVSGDNAANLARRCWDTLKAEWFKPEENGLQEVV